MPLSIKEVTDRTRRLLRQLNTKPVTDDDIYDAIDDAVDEICNRVLFKKVTIALDSVKGKSEYEIPLDTVEVINVFYKPNNAQPSTQLNGLIGFYDVPPGSTLKNAIDATQTTGIIFNEAFNDQIPLNPFPVPAPYVLVDGEKIGYTSATKDGNEVTLAGVTRGLSGTTAVAHSAGAGLPLLVDNASSFPSSGSIRVGVNEIMTYQGKGMGAFYGITRGESPELHNDNEPVVLVDGGDEVEQDFIELTPSTAKNLGVDVLNSDEGTPETFYASEGILGFNCPTVHNGSDNIVLTCYVRPDRVDREDDTIVCVDGLPETLYKALRMLTASVVATSLASDSTAQTQATLWNQMAMGSISQYLSRHHQFVRGNAGQIVPFTGRISK